MTARDGLDTSAVAVVGVVGALVVFVIIVALQGWFYREQEAETARKYASWTPPEVSSLRARHEAQLNSYQWVDRENGVVAIPIDVAMDLIVREGSGKSKPEG